MNSVLHRVTAAQIEREPFPHVVIDDAVEPELYRELAATMPSEEMILRGRIAENNTPYRLSAHDMLALIELAVWREFVRLHTSKEFFDDGPVTHRQRHRGGEHERDNFHCNGPPGGASGRRISVANSFTGVLSGSLMN